MWTRRTLAKASEFAVLARNLELLQSIFAPIPAKSVRFDQNAREFSVKLSPLANVFMHIVGSTFIFNISKPPCFQEHIPSRIRSPVVRPVGRGKGLRGVAGVAYGGHDPSIIADWARSCQVKYVINLLPVGKNILTIRRFVG